MQYPFFWMAAAGPAGGPSAGRRWGHERRVALAGESGDVSTQDVLSRFVAALGGTLKLIADFGDEQLKLA
jgi:hypothetical protein